jgi:hypothetical protein
VALSFADGSVTHQVNMFKSLTVNGEIIDAPVS